MIDRMTNITIGLLVGILMSCIIFLFGLAFFLIVKAIGW
jgi:MFS superfamily sulfate permease-like transporter